MLAPSVKLISWFQFAAATNQSCQRVTETPEYANIFAGAINNWSVLPYFLVSTNNYHGLMRCKPVFSCAHHGVLNKIFSGL